MEESSLIFVQHYSTYNKDMFGNKSGLVSGSSSTYNIENSYFSMSYLVHLEGSREDKTALRFPQEGVPFLITIHMASSWFMQMKQTILYQILLSHIQIITCPILKKQPHQSSLFDADYRYL